MPTDPEPELLFRLLQTAGNRADANRRIEEIVRGDPDWDEILRLTSHHGLTSQLYHALAGLEERVPAPIWQRLQSQYRENTTRNLQYSQRLHEVSEVFREHDVRAIPYKGPVVTEYAYEDLGSRWFGDLDFLVAKADVLRAREVLQAEGYEQLNYTEVPAETLLEGTVFRWGEEFRFRSANDDVLVELRFGFIGGTRPDVEIFDDMWDRRTSLPVAGQSISVLSPTDRALLLLVHGTKHGWRRLSWVYDVALLLQRDIAWGEVLARAEQYGWRNAVLFGLAVTCELSGADVPPCVRYEINERRHTWAASALAAVFHRTQTDGLTRLEPICTVLFLSDTASGSLRELFDIIVAPRKSDFRRFSLPPKLYPLYYLVRPCRLGGDALGRLVKWGR